MLTYDIERGKSLRFSYRTSTSPPSVNQLQEVVDNSNPMLLSSGNPDLDHSYSHFFMSRYNATNTEKSTNFIAAVLEISPLITLVTPLLLHGQILPLQTVMN
jgi:hypothetical protein